MRIPSGKTDIVLYFVALDTGLTTRVTGLTTFTVYRSRNGGTATVYTTPTVTELSAANMPGVYSLLVDEDTTIASTSDSEEYAVHITATGMAPVTRTIELYRREVTTGTTLTTADVTAIKAKTDSLTFTTALRVDSQVFGMQANTVTATAIATDAIGSAQLAATAVTEINTGIATAASITTLTGYVDTEVAAILAAVDTEVASILTKVNTLPASPAAVSDIPTAIQNADALLDRANALETGLTVRGAMRLNAAALAGKISGAGTATETFRNAVQDSKNRIVSTVDASGNRSAITTDVT